VNLWNLSALKFPHHRAHSIQLGTEWLSAFNRTHFANRTWLGNTLFGTISGNNGRHGRSTSPASFYGELKR
jgi:hypothetical protein